MRGFAFCVFVMLLIPHVAQAQSLGMLLAERGVIDPSVLGAPLERRSVKLYWNKGPTFEFPDSGVSMRVNSLLQTRYTFTNFNDASGKSNTSNFGIRRARLITSGTVLEDKFSYQLMVDFVGRKGTDGAAISALRDGFIEWHASDWLALKFGQFKTNLSRQFLSSASVLQFADRSVVSDYFYLDRQSGAIANTKWMEGRFELGAGIFNGESDGESGPNNPGLDTKHTGILSARYALLGKMNAYQEGDLDWSEVPAISIGGSFALADSNQKINDTERSVQQQIMATDLNLKYQGASLHSELYRNGVDVVDADEDATPVGFYAQAGYFLIPQSLELAGRYGYVDCDNGKARGRCTSNDSLTEVVAGLNYFFSGHNLKAQLDYAHISEEPELGGDAKTSDRWILQLQSYL